ncbi:MAG: GIDE domain-containing protein [Actinomycetota bacterium]|nr:GIDE domain-containing protein [Actinomycetota bacterium]
MAVFIIGAILIIGGALLSILVPIKIKNKNIEIKFMKTTAVDELKDILAYNASAGLEGYRHYVELNGQAVNESMNKAPFSGNDVAFFNADLFAVSEDIATSTDNKSMQQSIRKSETLLNNQKSSSPISLRDFQSKNKVYIDINQSGLKIDTLKTFDKFEPSNTTGNYSFLRNINYKKPSGKMLGFRMVENTIPYNQLLYVLGDAVLNGDKINILRPADGKPFIVSVKEKADIVRGNESGARAAIIFGILIAIAGILMMIFIK